MPLEHLRRHDSEINTFSDSQRYFIRLNLSEKVQHLVFGACFIVLVATGFMLKIPASYVEVLGPFGENVFLVRSLLHRIAGIVMILVSSYHVYYLLMKPAGRRWFRDMLPKVKDVRDLIDIFRYYLGARDAPPDFDRFCYKHKLEYGALIAGTTIMGITGIMLWSEANWSKFLLDIAALVHGMEAILASLAIMIWHLYDVHFKPHKFPMDNLWLTGLMDEATMKAEHPLHYAKIMADPRLREIYIFGGDDQADMAPGPQIETAN